MREWPQELLDAKVQFWACVNPAHRHVTWTGDVAMCDTCGLTSEHTKRRDAIIHEALTTALADRDKRIADALALLDPAFVHGSLGEHLGRALETVRRVLTGDSGGGDSGDHEL